MADLISIVAVAVGGAFGAVARFWLSGTVGRHIGEVFPWGTLVVNVSGGMLIGAVAAGLGSANAPSSLPWLLIVTGFLGGYTTVSSFTLQTLNLVRVGERTSALANVAVSVLLSFGAAAAGFTLISALLA